MLAPDAALERLTAGNRRFVEGELRHDPTELLRRRAELVAEQRPFAVVLGCADSRVPAELIFDQGLGDLFVIRVAGNVVAPSQVGSVEYAIGALGTRLIVVLGHTSCGAVAATLAELERPSGELTANLADIVERIRPAVATLLEVPELRADRERLLAAAVRANVRMAVDHLRHGSRVIEEAVRTGRVRVVGGEYDLASGKVTFF